MREFPVFLSMLFLIYVLIERKSNWLVGLALLSILDAKEYVLYMILPALILYIAIVEWKGFNFESFTNIIKGYIQAFLPFILFLLLMIFTSVIPINTYALSVIPGVTRGGVEYQIRHFSPEMATSNRIEEAASIQQEIEETDSTFDRIKDLIIGYLGKTLYPRSFSFLSIPKLIFLPAFLTSIFYAREYFRQRDLQKISLLLIFWSFILIFVLRASFDRYLFPILPIVVIFFLYFIKDQVKERKKFLLITLISGFSAMLGMFFEADYVFIKIILNLLILCAFLFYAFYFNKIKDLEKLLIIGISGITFSVVSFFFYANGQLNQYLLWGNDFEIQKIVRYFKDDERIMINDVGWDILPKVYRGDNRYNPEWKWELEEWVPRKKELKMFEKFTTYNIYGANVESDRILVERNDIDKLVLVVSDLPDKPFRLEERLEDYLDANWLSLLEVIPLKNKQVYIFDVL
jgi:hypothetical protein